MNWERMWEELRGLEGEKSVVKMYYMREEYIVKIANDKRTTGRARAHMHAHTNTHTHHIYFGLWF